MTGPIISEGRCLSADPFAIPASSVLAYRKYAPRDSPPASLGFDRNTPTFWDSRLGGADPGRRDARERCPQVREAGRGGPSAHLRGPAADAKPRKARQVDGGRQQGEVLSYTEPAAHASPSPAMLAAHQVSDLAFDLGPGGAIARAPSRIALSLARVIEPVVLGVTLDAAAPFG